jgi:uncharacterized cupin superfamily protein
MNSKIVKVILVLAAIVAIILFFFQIHSWYMQYTIYTKKIDEIKRTSEMHINYENFRNKLSLSSDINPQFKAEIKDFDFRITATVSDSQNGTINSGIWKYKPGQYCLSATYEGTAILEVIEGQLDDILERNINNNMVIEIEAIGSADALPYRKKVYYDGILGDCLSNLRYYRFDKPNTPLYITFMKGETLMTNENLALLRAYDAVKYLKERYFIEDEDIRIFTREFAQIGAEYRRLDLQITLRNAFFKEYNELGYGARFFLNKFE